ncbi:hypothetical protein EUTSA_v10006280mg [Eutrema salsugineum]|uniref:NYN domain-containing protein n=1 Tax=Eutrema salsugineum TaxID=72664 RepID=V4LN68_EUTSA|nr:uncharacterized protein LOC18019824 [Eutrema salsugineum]ESQ43927.1 hypothetical protein EUTSA_v10006280mg [Eutrema salsugineum]
MSFPLKVYKDGNTCVFWDVSNYPIPDGQDPVLLSRDIKEALVKEGFNGEVTIKAYVDKLSDELQSQYSDANVKVTIFPEGGKFGRISFMLVDVLMWAMSNPGDSNLIVLSKNVIGDAISSFQGLYARNRGVLLSDTDPTWSLPCETALSFLTCLFDNRRKR